MGNGVESCRANPDCPVQLRLLGPLTVARQGQPLTPPSSRKARAVSQQELAEKLAVGQPAVAKRNPPWSTETAGYAFGPNFAGATLSRRTG